jgi:alkylglycerol monooxygenase
LGVLDTIFVTPSNHRVHHAQNERYIDKNYGGVLILWDRLFGTFEDESSDEPVIFGVRKPLASWNPFWANFQIYDYLLFDARHTAKWKDKIGIWFRHTGWRPADVAEHFPKSRAELSAFTKFDPPLTRMAHAYVLLQFFLVLAQALVVSNMFATRDAGTVLVPCLLLWTHIYALGLLSEGRSYAVLFELVRLLIVLPLGTAMIFGVSSIEPLAWVAAYGGLSICGVIAVYRSDRPKVLLINQ